MATLEMFTNGTFKDNAGNIESVPCRLRGGKDNKTWKLPASAFSEVPEANAGIVVEITGELKVSGNYVTPADCKVLDVVAGAGNGGSHKENLDDYLSSLAETKDSDVPF